MHAEREIVLPILSVRLSVQSPMPVICLNEWTYRHTFLTFRYRGIILVLKFQGEPLSGGAKYKGVGKFCNIAIGNGAR